MGRTTKGRRAPRITRRELFAFLRRADACAPGLRFARRALGRRGIATLARELCARTRAWMLSDQRESVTSRISDPGVRWFAWLLMEIEDGNPIAILRSYETRHAHAISLGYWPTVARVERRRALAYLTRTDRVLRDLARAIEGDQAEREIENMSERRRTR